MKKKELIADFTIDMDEINEAIPVKAVEKAPILLETYSNPVYEEHSNDEDLISCLTNKKVIVRYIPRDTSIKDKKHVLYGGMAETSFNIFTVPKLKSGNYVNVLTNAEKAFLEAYMGLAKGTMNVYNRENNFWSTTTKGSIAKVRLTKEDTILDLSDPTDYIKYKILLANKELIAPNIEEYENRPKATYKYILITDSDVSTRAKNKMSEKVQCYIEYNKIKDDNDMLRTIIEIITGKPLASNTSIDFLQTTIGDLIEKNARLVLNVISDPTLATKILIKNANEWGIISRRGDYYYLASDGTPLCENNEEPILSIAAKYLNNPKRLELKFTILAEIETREKQ